MDLIVMGNRDVKAVSFSPLLDNVVRLFLFIVVRELCETQKYFDCFLTLVKAILIYLPHFAVTKVIYSLNMCFKFG